MSPALKIVLLAAALTLSALLSPSTATPVKKDTNYSLDNLEPSRTDVWPKREEDFMEKNKTSLYDLNSPIVFELPLFLSKNDDNL